MNDLETIAILFAAAENKPVEFYEIFSKYGADNIFKEAAEELDKSELDNKFRRECDKYDRLSDNYGQLKESYNILERKYWDAQRTIDQYDRDLKRETHFHNFWQKRYYEAVEEQMKLRKENKEPNDKIIAENLRLHNELTLAKMRENEQKKYLEAYQKLYVDEVIKNNNLKSDKSEPELIDALANQNCKLLDILVEKIKENVIKEEGE